MDGLPHKTSHKRSRLQRELDLSIIAQMALTRRTQIEISQWIGANRAYTLTRQQIAKDIKLVERRWQQEANVATDQRKAEELARLNRIEREAWDAIEASKVDQYHKSTSRKEMQLGDDAQSAVSDGVVYKSVSSTTRYADPRLLQIVMACIQKRCELLGLAQEPLISITAAGNNVIGLPQDHIDRILKEHYAIPITATVVSSNGDGGGNAGQNGQDKGNGEGASH